MPGIWFLDRGGVQFSSPPPQGPKPQQGDPAAPGPPYRSAAPHIQLPEDSPDGEGPAAGAGGGCRRLEPLVPPPPRRGAAPEGPALLRSPERLSGLLCEQKTENKKNYQKKKKKRAKPPQSRVIPFNLGVRVSVFVF